MAISEVSEKPYILTDIDDTVLECSGVLQKFIEENLGIKAKKPLRDTHYINNSFDLSISECDNIAKKFWDDPIFSTLEPEPCAKIVIPKLMEKYTFIGISNCHDAPVCKEHRGNNINKHFCGAFEYIFHTWPGGKLEYLDLPEYKQSIWVEDNIKNAYIGAKLGHRTFILDRPHNRISQNFDERIPITRVHNWHDIFQILEG